MCVDLLVMKCYFPEATSHHNYVALEPSTNRQHDARKRGELIELQPGETRHYRLELGVIECY
jgi:galactose mutarotase-like enzyme